MTNVVKAAPLPLDEIDTDHPIWKAYGDNGTPFSLVGVYNHANEILAKLSSVRNAASEAKTLIESSDTPEAIAYRELKSAADAAAEKADAEYDAAVAPLQAQIADFAKLRNERKAAITAKLTEALNTAVSAVTVDTVGGDVPTLVREYKSVVEQFKLNKTLIVSGGVEGLKGYNLPGPGVATGAAGTGKARSGETHAMGRPRFLYASVDGISLEEPTSASIAAAAGIKDADNFKTALLTAIGGVKEALPRFPETVTFELNGHTLTVSAPAHKHKDEHASEDAINTAIAAGEAVA